MPSGKFIILRCKKFKESDLIVDALSQQGEKFCFSARNALKSKKRFAGGVLEPMNYVNFTYTQGKSGLLTVQEGCIIYGFPRLREHYGRLQTAIEMLQLIQKGAKEGLTDSPILFDILGNGLRALEVSEKPHFLKLQFELKFLYHLGFLEATGDVEEFIARPISNHADIELTDSEYQYVGSIAQQHLSKL